MNGEEGWPLIDNTSSFLIMKEFNRRGHECRGIITSIPPAAPLQSNHSLQRWYWIFVMYISWWAALGHVWSGENGELKLLL